MVRRADRSSLTSDVRARDGAPPDTGPEYETPQSWLEELARRGDAESFTPPLRSIAIAPTRSEPEQGAAAATPPRRRSLLSLVAIAGLAVLVLAMGAIAIRRATRSDPRSLYVAGWLPPEYGRGERYELIGERPAAAARAPIAQYESGEHWIELAKRYANFRFPAAPPTPSHVGDRVLISSSSESTGMARSSVTNSGRSVTFYKSRNLYTYATDPGPNPKNVMTVPIDVWTAETSIEGWTIDIETDAGTATQQSIIDLLRLDDDGIPELGRIPSGWKRADGVHVETVDERVRREVRTTRYPGLDRGMSTPAFVTLAPSSEPDGPATDVVNGRLVWIMSNEPVLYVSTVRIDGEHVAVRVDRGVQRDAMTRIAGSVRRATAADRYDLAIAPLYSVGDQLVSGPLHAEGRLSNGLKWRHVNATAPEPGDLLGLVGVSNAVVNTRSMNTTSLLWAENRGPAMATVRVPTRHNPTDVTVTWRGATYRAEFLPVDGEPQRVAFLPGVFLTEKVPLKIRTTESVVTFDESDVIFDV